MSVKVSAYTPKFGNEVLPRVCERLRGFGLRLQFEPGLDVDVLTNKKAVIIRSRVSFDSQPPARYPSDEMLCEFELQLKDFRYSSPVSVDPLINQKLKACSRVTIVRMHSTHTIAFRIGMLFAATVAQLTDGIVYAPRSDAYLEPAVALEQFDTEIAVYEQELPEQDWRNVSFSSW